MYDFWYTLGLTMIRPTLLQGILAIKQRTPIFNFVPRTIQENGKPVPGCKGSPSTGTLYQGPTEDVRQVIVKFVKAYSASAPPIGFYTAGRFCQLVSIPKFDSGVDKSSFVNIVDHLHWAYLEGIGAGPESSLAMFPAFLGLMAMDARVAGTIGTADSEEPLAEFGIQRGTREEQILVGFAGSGSFAKGFGLLMAGDSNPWEENPTMEQMFWWDDAHSAHSIP